MPPNSGTAVLDRPVDEQSEAPQQLKTAHIRILNYEKTRVIREYDLEEVVGLPLNELSAAVTQVTGVGLTGDVIHDGKPLSTMEMATQTVQAGETYDLPDP